MLLHRGFISISEIFTGLAQVSCNLRSLVEVVCARPTSNADASSTATPTRRGPQSTSSASTSTLESAARRRWSSSPSRSSSEPSSRTTLPIHLVGLSGLGCCRAHRTRPTSFFCSLSFSLLQRDCCAFTPRAMQSHSWSQSRRIRVNSDGQGIKSAY